MSTGPEEDPFKDVEAITTLNAFDEARRGLYDQLSLVAAEQKRLDEYKTLAEENGELAVATFVEWAKAILNTDSDMDDKKSELMLLWHQDELERVTMLAGLTDCSCFTDIPDGAFEGMVEEIFETAESTEELINLVEEYYADHMSADLNAFASHLEEKYEHQGNIDKTQGDGDVQSKKAQIMRGIGNYALDVSKIAAGATIALWLSKRIRES